MALYDGLCGSVQWLTTCPGRNKDYEVLYGTRLCNIYAFNNKVPMQVIIKAFIHKKIIVRAMEPGDNYGAYHFYLYTLQCDRY